MVGRPTVSGARSSGLRSPTSAGSLLSCCSLPDGACRTKQHRIIGLALNLRAY